jgi:hypothetical protein
LTAVSTAVPVLGPDFGFDLAPDLVREAGERLIAVIQAIGGLIVTIMTILGRARANQSLVLKSAKRVAVIDFPPSFRDLKEQISRSGVVGRQHRERGSRARTCCRR